MSERVSITPAAAEVVRELQAKHGALLFHLSGGCCDGSAPMCLAQGDFLLGSRDLQIGEIEGCPFYIAADTYYKNSDIIIDVTPGRGASFSLEIPLGVRFLMSSKLIQE